MVHPGSIGWAPCLEPAFCSSRMTSPFTMPRMDGLTFARHVRERQELPIVFLTARDLPRDQLPGFDAGADDYVVKPFDGRLLAARIAAVLRRTAASQPDDPAIALGELRIDLDAMTVHRAGEPVSLSSTEFRLFETLLLNETAC